MMSVPETHLVCDNHSFPRELNIDYEEHYSIDYETSSIQPLFGLLIYLTLEF